TCGAGAVGEATGSVGGTVGAGGAGGEDRPAGGAGEEARRGQGEGLGSAPATGVRPQGHGRLATGEDEGARRRGAQAGTEGPGAGGDLAGDRLGLENHRVTRGAAWRCTA